MTAIIIAGGIAAFGAITVRFLGGHAARVPEKAENR
jgi:hypothetical protein